MAENNPDMMHDINSRILEDYYLNPLGHHTVSSELDLRNAVSQMPVEEIRVMLHFTGDAQYRIDAETTDIHGGEVLMVGTGVELGVLPRSDYLQVFAIQMMLETVITKIPHVMNCWYKGPIQDDLAIRDIVRRMKLAYDRVGLRRLGLAEMTLRLSHERRQFRHDNTVVRRVIHHIESRNGVDCSLSDLAALAGLSLRQLQRVFKQEIGVSPKEYCIQHRINRARQLLHDASMRVCDVALSLGYSDQFAFSRQFKRQLGYSPKAYQQRVAGPF